MPQSVPSIDWVLKEGVLQDHFTACKIRQFPFEIQRNNYLICSIPQLFLDHTGLKDQLWVVEVVVAAIGFVCPGVLLKTAKMDLKGFKSLQAPAKICKELELARSYHSRNTLR